MPVLSFPMFQKLRFDRRKNGILKLLLWLLLSLISALIQVGGKILVSLFNIMCRHCFTTDIDLYTNILKDPILQREF